MRGERVAARDVLDAQVGKVAQREVAVLLARGALVGQTHVLAIETTSAASTPHIWAALAQIFSRSSVAAFLAASPVTYVPELAYEPASNGDTSVSTPRTTIIELSTPSSSAAICARIVSTPMPLSVRRCQW